MHRNTRRVNRRSRTRSGSGTSFKVAAFIPGLVDRHLNTCLPHCCSSASCPTVQVRFHHDFLFRAKVTQKHETQVFTVKITNVTNHLKMLHFQNGLISWLLLMICGKAPLRLLKARITTFRIPFDEGRCTRTPVRPGVSFLRQFHVFFSANSPAFHFTVSVHQAALIDAAAQTLDQHLLFIPVVSANEEKASSPAGWAESSSWLVTSKRGRRILLYTISSQEAALGLHRPVMCPKLKMVFSFLWSVDPLSGLFAFFTNSSQTFKDNRLKFSSYQDESVTWDRCIKTS